MPDTPKRPRAPPRAKELQAAYMVAVKEAEARRAVLLQDADYQHLKTKVHELERAWGVELRKQ